MKSFIFNFLPPPFPDSFENSTFPIDVTLVANSRGGGSCEGAETVPLVCSRALMLCAPGFSADTSSVPESMSSISDRAVSKLLFMVVAITPVGPVFTQPLQYRPGETCLSELKAVSLIAASFLFIFCGIKKKQTFVWFLLF